MSGPGYLLSHWRDLAIAALVAIIIALVAVRLPDAPERAADVQQGAQRGAQKSGQQAKGTVAEGGTRDVEVIDGDSLRVGGREVRLFGIDAPEGRQSCSREDGRRWRCGAAAARELRKIIGKWQVSCVQVDEDRYGRMVARCHAGGRDMNEAMVEAGYALAYRKFTHDYIDEEDRARAARRGMWRGRFVRPSDWRAEHRRH